MQQSSGYKAVKRLAVERPDWLPIVQECLQLSKEIKGDFAGAWVYSRVCKKGIKFSNLRLLTSFGILKKEDTSRGGRRAYYSLIDSQGIEEALKELKIINENQTSPT